MSHDLICNLMKIIIKGRVFFEIRRLGNGNFGEDFKSWSFREFFKDGFQVNISAAKSVDFMKSLIDLWIRLEAALSRIAKDIWLDCFLMQILASLTIGAVSSLVILFARLGLVLDMSQNLGFKFISSMCKATFISEFAGTSELPVFAHFSFVFSFVFLNKLTSFFWVVKLFTFWANINFKRGRVIHIYWAHTAWGREDSGASEWFHGGISIAVIVRVVDLFIFRSVWASEGVLVVIVSILIRRVFIELGGLLFIPITQVLKTHLENPASI